MGSCVAKISHSIDPDAFYRQNQNYAQFRPAFDALKLQTSDIARLASEFEDADMDGSGEISINEFFKYLGLASTPFSRRTFSLFDYDESGELDFREFCISLWNYCTSDSYALISFAFDLYDLDGSGSINVAEMVNVCREVYGGTAENSRAKSIMKKLKRRSSMAGEETTKMGFVQFCKKHPALLFPAFELQGKLSDLILGKRFWRTLAKARDREFGKEKVDINWLRAQVTRNAFVEIAEAIGSTGNGVRKLRPKMVKVKVLVTEARGRQLNIEDRVERAKMANDRKRRGVGRKLRKRRKEQEANAPHKRPGANGPERRKGKKTKARKMAQKAVTRVGVVRAWQ